MKKKLFLLVGLFSLFFSSCNLSLDEQNNSDNKTEYGSVCIYKESGDRALYMEDLVYASAYITGTGITSEISNLNIKMDNGTGSFEIEKVPAGKNRVVTIKALNEYKSELFGVTIRAVVDVEAGKVNPVTVNWKSTALGTVFAKLLENDEDLSSVNRTEIENVIDSSVHSTLIDTDAIVVDYLSGSLKDKSKYVMQPASLTLSCDTGTYTVQVCDPSSKVVSVTTGSASVTNIAPGTWNVLLLDSSNKIVKQQSVQFTSGKTEKVTWTTISSGKTETINWEADTTTPTYIYCRVTDDINTKKKKTKTDQKMKRKAQKSDI